MGGDARPVTHLYKAAKCYMEGGGGGGGVAVTIRAKTSLARSVKAGGA